MDICLKDVKRDYNPKKIINREMLYVLDSQKIVVIGGAGSIGSAVVKRILQDTISEIWILDNDESRVHTLVQSFSKQVQARLHSRICDIRDWTGLHNVLQAISPDVIVHAAALKHVSVLELQPREGYLTNIVGTKNIIDFVRTQPKARLVFISSDKAAEAKNILGQTKYVGELLVNGLSEADRLASLSRTHSIVRFGNVFMSRGSVVETFIAQLNAEQEVTITDMKMERFFMDVEQAAELIIKAMCHQLPGVTLYEMGEPVRISELVKSLAANLGVTKFSFKVIGIKEGEKLSEDLFNTYEKPFALAADGILQVEVDRYLPIDGHYKMSVDSDDDARKEIVELLSRYVLR